MVIDHGHLYDFPAICYRGNPVRVMEVIAGLLGAVFQEDQGIQASRYGKTKLISIDKDQFFETNAEVRAEHMINNPKEVALWEEYDTKSDTVLVLSDLGPQGDGTELYATEIKAAGLSIFIFH